MMTPRSHDLPMSFGCPVYASISAAWASNRHMLNLPQALPTENRWGHLRTRLEITNLLRALRSYTGDMPQAPADARHPLTGGAYPQSGLRRGAQGPALTLQADLDRAIAHPSQNLITLRIQAALVGFFLGWPAQAVLANFPTLQLSTFIWKVLRRDSSLPTRYVFILYYDDTQLREFRELLQRRPRR